MFKVLWAMIASLLGMLALIYASWKGHKAGKEEAIAQQKSEMLDEFVKVDKEIRDHADDPIDDVLSRMSNRADR